jgi:hypothetical protein
MNHAPTKDWVPVSSDAFFARIRELGDQGHDIHPNILPGKWDPDKGYTSHWKIKRSHTVIGKSYSRGEPRFFLPA